MEDGKSFHIYGLLHSGLKKEGFFKSRKLKNSRVYIYKMHNVLFENPVKNDKLAENENKSINSFLGLDEKLPQTISFLHYNEIAPFGYEYSFISEKVKILGSRVSHLRLSIDDTIKNFVEDRYKKRDYLQEKEGMVFML